MPPASIASSRPRFYLTSNMLRFLSSLLVAVALLLSPLAMASGAGMAMPQAAAATNAADEHCAGGQVPADDDRCLMKVGCASSCAAYPPFTPLPQEKPSTVRAKPGFARSQPLAGIHPEGETPPPRMTPEI